MSDGSPFQTQWRDCLRAHYQHVIRTDDKVTLRTLTGVLGQVGFSETELAELAVTAVMHVDDLPPDFTPDLTVMAAIAGVTAAPDPDDAPIPELIAAAEAAAEAAQPDLPPPIDESGAEGDADPLPAAPDPDGPQQLAMF